MNNRPFEHQFPAFGMSPSKYRHPWLVYLHGERRQHQTFCKTSSSGVIFKRIPEFRDVVAVLYCSADGKWLLLHQEAVDVETLFFLWSPATGESIELPPLRPYLPENITIHHGFVSTDSHLLVILFSTEVPLILYCRVGDRQWCEFNYAQTIEAQTGTPLSPRRRYYLCSPVSFNGNIYATANCYTDLVQILIDDNNHCEMHLLMPEDRACYLKDRSSLYNSYIPHYRATYLVSLGDKELCQIIMFPRSSSAYRESLSIVIFTFNFSTNDWEPRTSLNGGAVFLCDSYSLYSSQGAPMGSAHDWSYIYFTFRNDHTLFCYRVEDERVTHSLCPPKLQDPWRSCWIMPGDEYIHDLESVKCSGELIDGKVDPLENQKRKREADSREIMRGTCKRLMISKINGVSECGPTDGNSLICEVLSSEVLGLIAGKLPFIDYMHFRRVNKVCSSSTIRSRINPFPPCLVYQDTFKGVFNIVDSNLKHVLSFKVPEALNNYRIQCSRNGWLLLEYKFNYAFFNPLTMQVVLAGQRPLRKHGVMNSTFLGKPSFPDCSILAVFQKRTRGKSHFVKRLPKGGEAKWWTFVLGEEGAGMQQFRSQGCNSPVVLKEVCYYLGNNGMLGRGKFSEDGESLFQWEILEDLVFPDIKFRWSYLTECGG